jgi:hypothetical protein
MTMNGNVGQTCDFCDAMGWVIDVKDNYEEIFIHAAMLNNYWVLKLHVNCIKFSTFYLKCGKID